jgi:bacillithiol biosynthesis cysteine-adding enzyme BshC
MSNTKFPYQNLRFYSDLIKDYLDQNDAVAHLYGRFPHIQNFKEQILEKQTSWESSTHKRNDLAQVLRDQYTYLNLDADHPVLHNVHVLSQNNTFTVTTGHQLNLFTGPLYFLYKIASTINLCKQLTDHYLEFNFVPVYWMATEDHDFEEIQFFNYGDRKLVYERQASGAVGRMSTTGLDQVSETFSNLLGHHDHANFLKSLFHKAYVEHDNLADATRFIAHEIFGDHGLVILDGDDSTLKSHASSYFKDDLLEQVAFNEVSKVTDHFQENHKVQVNPREVNLFYLTDDHRGRIIRDNDSFTVDGSDLQFSQKEILTELEQFPERFSPNVILRPLYQEVILPNLCYIGGGGEIAYWLELKAFFDASKVTFPILLLRNSAQLITKKAVEKASALDLEIQDLFQKDYELENQVTKQISEISIDFSTQKEHLKNQFKELYEIAHNTEKSFETAVAAQEHKQIKGLENLEKRLLKAQKRKLSDQVHRATDLQAQILPNGNLQERVINFSYYYATYGSQLIETIMDALDPLDLRFTCVVLNENRS